MVKVRKISDSSTPAKKTFSKNRSFSGVESKKTPKNRRKSIATILPTPLKHAKKANEWTISEEVDNTEFTETSDIKEDALNLSTPKGGKKKKRTSLGNVANLSAATDSKVIQNKNKISTSKNIDDAHVPTVAIKSINDKKKSKVTSTPVQANNIDLKTKPNSSKASQSVQSKAKLEVKDLQEKYNVKVEDVKNAVKGVIKLRSQNPKLKNQLFSERYPLLLQICCVKLPRGHSKILRIPLPHSILTPDDEICLIVPEVKGINNIDHEKHVEHYEELLRNKGVTNIKKIMTCHELRTEYETFEQKSRLVDLYEIFLVGGKVSGKVVKKCGKSFYKKRKVPIPVKLQASKLKEHIEKALSKVYFFLHLKGDSYTVQFGHNQMEEEELVENIYAIIDFLDKQFPGGFENFKGMQVYAPRATSIPIYMSLKPSNDVRVPHVKSKKPKAYKSYKDELTTLYNAEVIVQPTGEVRVKRQKEKESAEDDIITDLDIIKANGDGEKGGEGRETKKSRKRKQNREIVGDALKKKKLDVEASQEENVESKGKMKKVGKDVSDNINVQNKKLSEKVSSKDVDKKKLKAGEVSVKKEKGHEELNGVKNQQIKSLKNKDSNKVMKKKNKKSKPAVQE